MNIKLEDLFNPCGACGGSGNNEQPVSDSQGNTYGRTAIKNSRNSVCLTCNGSGFYELTESGEVLKRFLKILRERGMWS